MFEKNALLDRLHRPLKSLRISVTDRCNLRCHYCMPHENYEWLPREHFLTFEEILRLTDIFSRLGVEKVRLTGGEPLLRNGIPTFIHWLSEKGAIKSLAITTNGIYLTQQAKLLWEAGLRNLTVSLDTLQSKRFEQMTRKNELGNVLDGLFLAQCFGFRNIKTNFVVIRGVNDDEIIDMLEFGRKSNIEVRFIEYMDVGGATHWTMDDVVPKNEILTEIRNYYGSTVAVETTAALSSPAKRYILPDGAVFGIIASVSEPFCEHCIRSRLTADGMWYLCLYAKKGIDLKKLLRQGASDAEIAASIASGWQTRNEQGAKDRMDNQIRTSVFAAHELKRDPHLEMHTRGG